MELSVFMEFSDSIMVGEMRRTYVMHVPDSGNSHALILAFHGSGGIGKGMPILTHFNRIADREDIIVIYPDGYRRHWTDNPETTDGANDLAFVSALIEKIVTERKIDPRRVYTAGISNGGFFSQRLAIEVSEKISAIATVAATMPLPLPKVQMLSKPVSVMLFHGTLDSIVPYEGGHVKKGAKRPILSAHDSAVKWAQLNGCSSNPKITYLPNRKNDSTNVHTESFTQCRENSEVILYVVEGGGHTWPGRWQYFPERIIGKTSENIDASEEMVAFFKRH